MSKRVFEIVLDLGYVYEEDGDAAYNEANRIMHDNGNVDWTLVETSEEAIGMERAASDLLAACEAAYAFVEFKTHGDESTKTAEILRAAIKKAKGGAR